MYTKRTVITRETGVKRFQKFSLLFLLAMLTIGMLTACKKKADKSLPEEKDSSAELDANMDSVPVKTYRHGILPVAIEVPESANVVETDDDMFVNSPEYALYAFGMDTYNGGIVYDESEILSFLTQQNSIANDMIRLRDFTVDQNSRIKVYENINGTSGFLYPMSGMVFESRSGDKCEGSGFAFVCKAKRGIGVYVVLGIVKGTVSSEQSTKVQNLLENCAFSLKQDDYGEGEFEFLKETMPDETGFRLAYRKGTVTAVEKYGEGYSLYYDNAKKEGFNIGHDTVLSGVTSSDYLKSIIDAISENEGVTFSETDFVRGKMEYRKVTMSYKRDEQEMQEVICVSVSDEGSLWIVDLYGTAEDVAAQQENLTTLLWSLTEE